MTNILLLITYFVLTCSGLTFMKLGTTSPLKISFEGGLSFSIGFVSLAGYVLYLCSFLLFTKLVTMFDLSYIMPLSTGVVQIVSVIIAMSIFHEQLRPVHIAGIVLVIAGVVAMNLQRT